MKNHNEFMKEAADANALPAQTCRALGPESEEDISMYANDSQPSVKRNKIEARADASLKSSDANCEGDEK